MKTWKELSTKEKWETAWGYFTIFFMYACVIAVCIHCEVQFQKDN